MAATGLRRHRVDGVLQLRHTPGGHIHCQCRGGGLAARRGQKTPVNLLAANVELCLSCPGCVITLDLASVLGSGALWSTPSEPPGHRLSATGSAFDRVREAGWVRKHDLVAAGHLH